MEKVRAQLTAPDMLFTRIAEEAAERDRSPSWVVSRRLEEALPALAFVQRGCLEARDMKKLGGGTPRTFFIPKDVKACLDAEAERLALSPGQMLAWAFSRGTS